MQRAIRDQTIKDFGAQWTRFTDNDGYYGSAAMLDDLFGELIDLDRLRDARVADIGAGTGRFVQILLQRGAQHVIAVEPSAAMDILKQNTLAERNRVTYIHAPGEDLPPDESLDFVFSIGVLHHVPDPSAVVESAYQALRPGGHMLVWLYGREGNATYLTFALPLRALVKGGPHWLLNSLVWVLYFPIAAYIRLCRRFRLPMRRYMQEVLGQFSPTKIRLVIYDQLKPSYSKYYRRAEAVALLEREGFRNVRAYHRHGYSWSVCGTKGEPVCSRDISSNGESSTPV